MNRTDLPMAKEIGELLENPNGSRFYWRIPDFFSLELKIYTSPNFAFSDSAWILNLYPNNVTGHESEGIISLYLRRLDSRSSKSVRFTLGIKRADGTDKIILRDSPHAFEKDGLGVRSFLSREVLLTRKTEYAPSDVVTVFCTLKSECTTKVSLFSRLWKLSQNLEGMLYAKRRTDVVFKLKDGELQAHKIILESRSTVFDGMFQADMQEAQTGVVNVQDIDKEVFEVILLYLYNGDPAGLSPENMSEVFKVAHKYNLQDMSELCVDFMKKNLTTDSICDVFAVAHLYQEKSLKEFVIDYFANNKVEIFKSEKWKSCKIENPEIVLELMECALGGND